MNSYGDQQSARARARVPGPAGVPTPDDDQRYDEAPDSYRSPQSRPAGGRASVSGAASVGAAPTGRASVGTAPAGRASVGSASVGSARVGAHAPVGRPAGEDGYARPGTPGRAVVARAAVRPTPGYNGMGELGGPAGGGPVGGGPGGGGPGGGGRGDRNDPGRRAKRRRRTNILTAAAAVLVILLGAGVVGGTYFFDDVKFEAPKAGSQTTQIFYSDGKTPIANIGEQNRSVVPEPSINPVVKNAVMAAEDKNFLEHGGIDMKGIARAAWNNFSGGDTQGASTITQQYARDVAKLKEISYNRKLREAVIARKMETSYSKAEILGGYLNAVYFGRGAYGIEAAAKAYFGKSVLTPPASKNAVTAAEAAVLASVIKQPEPVAGGHKGYDPQNNPEAALERWNYTLNNMVEKGWLDAAARPTQYPKFLKFDPEKCKSGCVNNNKPAGKIIKYVIKELEAMGISKEEWQQGGLQVTTTIDPKVQKAAEDTVRRSNDESPMHDLAKTYRPAVVAINPENGRVLAYYGGPDKVGWDYAGPNYNDTGKFVGGGRPPGSSFKIYTLLAALKAGYGFDTTWDADKENDRGQKINNSSRENLRCDKRRCPLDTATVESYNFPFYWIADALGQYKVLEAAHDAGINQIEDTNGDFVNLANEKGEKLNSDFGKEVGFGQYAVFPVDHANGIATIANEGVYNKAHFVVKVQKRGKTGLFERYKSEQLRPDKRFERDQISDLDSVLKEIPGHNGRSLRNGRPAIGKTGTWEYSGKKGKKGDNGDAWMVGATPKLAASVWVGNYNSKNEPLPIFLKNGSRMTGGSVPGAIWKMFMDAANEAMDAPVVRFPDRVKTGDPTKTGNGLPPVVVPQTPPDQGGICIPPFCVRNGNGDDNGGQGDNGQPGTDPGDGDVGDGNGGVPPDDGGGDPDRAGGNGAIRDDRTLPVR
jgi:membrane peptidoglycan carboxypeptidase